MKRFIIMVLAAAMLLFVTACNKNVTDNQSTDNTSATDTNKDEDTFTVSVYGLELKYPAKWQDKVSVVTSDNRACFACGETKLFDLTFNSDEGDVLGTVENGENIVIRIVNYLIQTEDLELYAMKEDVNVILQHLSSDYKFTFDEVIEEVNISTFDIETSVVTLKYPLKWQEKVQYEVSDDGVKFSNNGTPLFDLMFVECNGYLLGTYNGTPIYIVNYDFENDEQAVMQEDVNVILQNLMEDENFVISK